MAELSILQKEQLNRLGLSDAVCGRRVLLTGATGFVGRHLLEVLVDMGAEVFALSRSVKTDSLGVKVHDLRVDLKSLKETRKAVEFALPEVVFHLA